MPFYLATACTRINYYSLPALAMTS